MKLSLKLTYFLSCVATIIALVILGVVGVFSNILLAHNQSKYIKAAAIGAARTNMNAALTTFLVRETFVLTSRDLEELDAVPARKSSEKKFNDGLDALANSARLKPILFSQLNAIRQTYNDFLQTDEGLLTVAKVRIRLKNELKDELQNLNSKIDTLRNSADAINGILNLEDQESNLTLRNKIQSKNFIRSPNVKEVLSLTIDKITNNDQTAALSISSRMNVNLDSLNNLLTKIAESLDEDSMNSIKNNDAIFLLSSIKRQISQLAVGTNKNDKISSTVKKMAEDIDYIDFAMINKPQNVFALRQSLNQEEKNFTNLQKRIQNNIDVFNTQLTAIGVVVANERQLILHSAEKTTSLTKSTIIIIEILVVGFVLGESILIFVILSRALNTFRSGMKKIADSDGMAQSQIALTRFSDLNNLINMFNKMANNLYYTQNNMHELVAQKTQALTTANVNLALALKIANLGYWTYDRNADAITWSSEMSILLGYDDKPMVLGLDKMLQLIHIDERNLFAAKLREVPDKHTTYEVELRLKKNDGEYNWFYITGKIILTDIGAPIISNIAMDIASRKTTESELEALNQKLLTSARRAGMADVATSILHNVGNILNSVKVSTALIKDQVSHDDVKKLIAVCDLVTANMSNLADYLQFDEKGKLLPKYLVKLVAALSSSQGAISQEIINISDKVAHIESIVGMQKSIGGVTNTAEKVFLPSAVESAIQMCGSIFEASEIKINKEYTQAPYAMVDKSKLLQILVNLLHNARDALTSHEYVVSNKNISINLSEQDESIRISVKDNGAGIRQQDLVKIFSLGFTTKPTGHGFGLHSSALAAKDLGGSLNVISDGLGEGATFVLIIPAIRVKPAGVKK